ncbi:MAG TPA: ribosomal protein S18-alanine N-acetyltransferase [Nocardioidaceae bacterium]|nr:ribosomal protein S18-alanine N-acetyltransferase [Nocardioidaceae bacterium]
MTTVRAAAATDLDAVAALEARVFADAAWSPRSVEEEFAGLGDTRRIVVAVDDTSGDGAVVGHAVLLAAGDTGDLTRVAVDRARRRLGIGSRLIDSLVAESRVIGLDAILLEVADTNTAAIALYERHAFEPIDRRRAYYPDGSDALVMRKPLHGSGTP